MARAEPNLDKIKAEVAELTDIALERWVLGKLAVMLKVLEKFF